MIGVHYEPFGIYSSKYAPRWTSCRRTRPFASRTIRPTRPARCSCFQDAGLITLPEGSTPLDSLNLTDVVEGRDRPADLRHRRGADALYLADEDLVDHRPQSTRWYAGLSPLTDAIFYEPADGEAASIYANYVVVRPEDVEAPWVEALRPPACAPKRSIPS